MSRYRRVDTRIWNDRDFRALPEDGKLAFLFLLTHPSMTMLGAMRATVGGLADELRWTPDRFRVALGPALEKGSVRLDDEASFVWLPRFLFYNPPENPNVVKAWGHTVDDLPECALRDQLVEHVRKIAGSMPDWCAKALPKQFAKQNSELLPNGSTISGEYQVPSTKYQTLPALDVRTSKITPSEWVERERERALTTMDDAPMDAPDAAATIADGWEAFVQEVTGARGRYRPALDGHHAIELASRYPVATVWAMARLMLTSRTLDVSVRNLKLLASLAPALDAHIRSAGAEVPWEPKSSGRPVSVRHGPKPAAEVLAEVRKVEVGKIPQSGSLRKAASGPVGARGGSADGCVEPSGDLAPALAVASLAGRFGGGES